MVVFKNYLMDQGVLTEEKEKEIQDQIAKEVNDATDYAEKAPYPEPETIHDHVYA